MAIVCFVGFASSGKDEAARVLIEQHEYHGYSFAESLKDTLATIFCWSRSMLSGNTPESREWRETVDQWWADRLNIPNFTPRWAMQNIGTDIMRKHFNNDIWILNTERKLSLTHAIHNNRIVISDGRFPNELAMVRRLGGKIIRIKRGKEPEWFDLARDFNAGNFSLKNDLEKLSNNIHCSEYSWIGQPIDVIIENNKDIEHLYSEVRRACLGS